MIIFVDNNQGLLLLIKVNLFIYIFKIIFVIIVNNYYS